MTKPWTVAERCRGCGDTWLAPVFKIGDVRVHKFLDPNTTVQLPPPIPLELIRCKGCGLVQNSVTADRSLLYDEYWYRSGLNEANVSDLREIVRYVETLVDLDNNDIVVDIASNDGTLLDQYSNKNLVTIGFDPAKNLEIEARKREKFHYTELFTAGGYKRDHTIKAKAITAVAVLYHLEDPVQFLTDVRLCLKDRGVFVAQVSYLPSMLENNAFDSIGHEHIEHYTLSDLIVLFDKAGLTIVDARLGDMNCGTLRLTAVKEDFADEERFKFGLRRVDALIHYEESSDDIVGPPAWETFSKKVREVGNDLIQLLNGIRAEGKRVQVYGASTKGSILMDYYHIGLDLVESAVERNPEKIGKVWFGPGLPVISEEESRKNPPDYYLALPWHFRSGFLAREQETIKRGTKFIFPLPQVKVVG